MDDSRDPVEELAEAYFAQRRSGAPISIHEFANQHPEWRDDLLAVLPTLAELEESVASSEPPPVAGTRMGDYELVREVGRGGMGIVYEALDTRLDRRVALKMLPPHASLVPALLERFRREASAAGRLRHSGIVPVYGVGEADGVHFYVMEFIDGEAVDARLARGPLDCREAARIALACADALAHAHAEGVVHRDIKPGNLMLDTSGAVRVTDFGLCMTEGAADLTQTRDVLGTLRYMAPEQLKGGSDARSDLCSLGLVLFELLTSRPAHASVEHVEVLREVADGRIPRPRRIDKRVPRDLETIVLKATDPDPAMRYATAEAMAGDLRAYLEDRPIQARRPSFSYLLGLAIRRNRGAAIGWAAAVILVIGGVAFYVQSLRTWQADERTQRIRAEQRGYAASIAAAQGAIEMGRTAAARQRLESTDPDRRHFEYHYLTRQLDGSSRTLHLGDDEIWALEFHPQGRLLAVADESRRVFLIDLEADTEPRILSHPRQVRAIAFDENGERLVTGDWAGAVRVFEVADGARTREIAAHGGPITGVTFDPAHTTLLTSSKDGSLAVWDWPSGTLRYRKTIGQDVWAPSVSVEGARFAASSRDGLVRIWRLQDGKLLHTLDTMRADRVNQHALWAVFGPEGRWFATTETAGPIRLYDAKTLQLVRTLPGDIHNWCIRFLDGKRLLAGRHDAVARVWNLETGAVMEDLRGHDLPPLCLASNSQGDLLATGAYGDVKLWRPPVLNGFFRLPAGTLSVIGMCAIDRRTLAVGDGHGRIYLWNLQTREKSAEWQAHEEGIWGLAHHAGVLYSSDRRGGVRAWDAATREALWQVRHGKRYIHELDVRFDGAEIVAASADLGALVLDPKDGSILRRLHDGNAMVLSARYLAGGSQVLVSHENGAIEVLDAARGRQLWHVAGWGSRCFAAPSPDGKLVAASYRDGRVMLRSAATGRVIREFSGHRIGPYWPAFSPDGRRIVTTAWDSMLKVWDTDSGLELVTLRDRPGWHFRAIFAPDGSWIAVGGTSGKLRVYQR